MPDMIVQAREATGKEIAKKLRAKGQIPSVLYGEGKNSVSLSVDEKMLLGILKSKSGRRSIINFELEGTKQKRFVIVKDYQLDPLSGRIIHADFLRIDMNKSLRVKVPVHTTGECAGVKQQGGIFEMLHHEVEVECLPANIPSEIVLDISPLMIGQSIRYTDLKMGDKVKVMNADLDQPICHVTAARAEEVAAVVEGAEKAEPEVITKGKKDEEGAEAAAPGAKPGAAKAEAKPAEKKK